MRALLALTLILGGAAAAVGDGRPEVDRLLDELRRPQGAASTATVGSLIRLGPVAVPAVIRALETDDIQLRHQLCQVLGGLGRVSAARRALLGRLDDGSPVVVQSARLSLAGIARGPHLRGLMFDAVTWEPEVRSMQVDSELYKLFRSIPSERMQKLAESALSDKGPRVRTLGLRAFGSYLLGLDHTPAVRDAAIGLLSDEVADVRDAAIQLAGSLRADDDPAWLVPLAQRWATEPDPTLRERIGYRLTSRLERARSRRGLELVVQAFAHQLGLALLGLLIWLCVARRCPTRLDSPREAVHRVLVPLVPLLAAAPFALELIRSRWLPELFHQDDLIPIMGGIVVSGFLYGAACVWASRRPASSEPEPATDAPASHVREDPGEPGSQPLEGR